MNRAAPPRWARRWLERVYRDDPALPAIPAIRAARMDGVRALRAE